MQPGVRLKCRVCPDLSGDQFGGIEIHLTHNIGLGEVLLGPRVGVPSHDHKDWWTARSAAALRWVRSAWDLQRREKFAALIYQRQFPGEHAVLLEEFSHGDPAGCLVIGGLSRSNAAEGNPATKTGCASTDGAPPIGWQAARKSTLTRIRRGKKEGLRFWC